MTEGKKGEVLLLITKDTNLKAIHNTVPDMLVAEYVVTNNQRYKFESNSQQDEEKEQYQQGCY